MKKGKYLFIFLITLCFMPNKVAAAQNISYTSYNMGDEITVTLDEDGKVKGKFRVIAPSEKGNEANVSDDYVKGTADYQYVTAIYETGITSSVFGKMDGLDYTSCKPVSYEDSIAKQVLYEKANSLGWSNYEELRLLTINDLNQLGSFAKTILKSTDNFWLGEDAYCKFLNTDTYSEEKALIAKIYEDSDWNLLATYQALYIYNSEHYLVDISNIKTTSQLIRPVIKIHKQFVEGGMVTTCADCEEDKTDSNDQVNDEEKEDSNTDIKDEDKNDVQEEDKNDVQEEIKDENNVELEDKKETEDKLCPNDEQISIQNCIDEGQDEEACIKKLCPGTEKIENPKTGNYLPIIVVGMVSLFVAFVYIFIKKKNYFAKIK